MLQIRFDNGSRRAQLHRIYRRHTSHDPTIERAIQIKRFGLPPGDLYDVDPLPLLTLDGTWEAALETESQWYGTQLANVPPGCCIDHTVLGAVRESIRPTDDDDGVWRLSEVASATDAVIAPHGVDMTTRTRRALDAIDLAIEPAKLTGILGVNGAPQSTLAKFMVGALPPTHGTATTVWHRRGCLAPTRPGPAGIAPASVTWPRTRPRWRT